MSAKSYHLCHLNIGPAKAPLFAPEMAGFLENLQRINELAYQSPGFVWHLKIDIYNPDDLAMYGVPGFLFNLSVWESVEALKNYTYQGGHAQMLQRRREWFGEMDSPSYVLWWIPVGELPTLEEAKERLQYLEAHGSSPYAFTFKEAFAGPVTIPEPDYPAKAIEPA